jgi:hypothetical protein
MTTLVWRAFIIKKTPDDFTIISENDKQLHTIKGEPRTGNIVLPNGVVVNVDEYIFTNSMLFSACREYVSDLRRGKRRYISKKEKKQKELKEMETKTSLSSNNNTL